MFIEDAAEIFWPKMVKNCTLNFSIEKRNKDTNFDLIKEHSTTVVLPKPEMDDLNCNF